MNKRVICILLCCAFLLLLLPAFYVSSADTGCVSAGKVSIRYPRGVESGAEFEVSVDLDRLGIRSCGVRIVLPQGLAFVDGKWNDSVIGEAFIKAEPYIENGYLHAGVVNFGDDVKTLDGNVFNYTLRAAENAFGTYTVRLEFSNEGDISPFELNITVTAPCESSEEAGESSGDEDGFDPDSIIIPPEAEAVHSEEFGISVRTSGMAAKSIGIMLDIESGSDIGFVSGEWTGGVFESAEEPFVIRDMSYDPKAEKMLAAVLTYPGRSVSHTIPESEIFAFRLKAGKDACGICRLTVKISVESDSGELFSVVRDVYLNVRGHEWALDRTVEPTCIRSGTAYYVCASCGAEKEETLAPDPANHAGDKELRGEKPAAFGEEGYTGDLYCVECGKMISEGEVIPALHKLADLLDGNYFLYYINEIQHVIIKGTVVSLPAGVTETDPEGAIVASAPLLPGDRLCVINQGKTLDEAIIVAVGDLTFDGTSDSNDAIYLLRSVLFPDDFSANQPGDFDGDGDVDSNDAIYLLRHTLFPDDFPI